MTTKTISTYVSAGYTLVSQYDTLDITTTGGVGGTGVTLSHLATLNNDGKVHATGSANGVHSTAGATIVNGSTAVTAAYIAGYSGVFAQNAATTVVNYGSIVGLGAYGEGVFLVQGGALTNGAIGDTAATVRGHFYGLNAGTATTVANYGTVIGYRVDGVHLASGSVSNGSAKDTTATIQGAGQGVRVDTGLGTVANFGTIASSAAAGILLSGGGKVTNGSAKDKTARISGYGDGVAMRGAGTVANFATIAANGEAGVYLAATGKVTNGNSGDTTALIAGYHGVDFEGAYGTVANFGTITGYDQSAILLHDGGLVTNGGKRDVGSLIQGALNGVTSHGAAASVINFGTILGGVSNVDAGVYLNGGSVTNGTAKDTTALIAGVLGVETNNGFDVTVNNFGTIEGTGGIAVQFLASSDVLIVEAGSAFVGQVLGYGGALDLASGTGTLAGVLAGGNVTVSGSMATTTFTNFGTLEIGAGADFSQTGATTIASGQAVINAGTLSLGSSGAGSMVNAGLLESTGAGVLTLASAVNNTGTIAVNGGTVTVTGAVTNAGVASIDGGTLDLASTFSENVTFTGTAGVLELARSRSYTGTISGFSQTGGTSLDLADIGFVSSSEATFSGTKSKGMLTVTDGTHTAQIRLTGDYRGSTFTASSDGHGGTIVVDPRAMATAAHRLIAAAAGLGGMAGEPLLTGASLAGHAPMLTRPHVTVA